MEKLDEHLEKLHSTINSLISPYIIIELMELEVRKSQRLLEQKYEQAATLRDNERSLIDKHPVLDEYYTIIKSMGLETLKQQIRNFKIYILLNE